MGLLMVRLLKMAVLLFSGHPWLNQCLFHLHPTHITDLPTYLAQLATASQRSGEGCAPLLVSLLTNEPT